MDRTTTREAANRDTVATIGSGITITGSVTSTTDLQVDGRISGDVNCGTLFLGETGVVEGNVQAQRVRVSGSVDGTVVAGDLAIEATGRVKGDVSYARLKVSAGAIIEASLKHRAQDVADLAPEPAPLKLVETPEAAAAEKPAREPRRVYGE